MGPEALHGHCVFRSREVISVWRNCLYKKSQTLSAYRASELSFTPSHLLASEWGSVKEKDYQYLDGEGYLWNWWLTVEKGRGWIYPRK